MSTFEHYREDNWPEGLHQLRKKAMPAYEITISSKYDTVVTADSHDMAADFAMEEYEDVFQDKPVYDEKLESIKEID